MTWLARQLKSYSKNGTTVTYTYDADGLRGSKTVNGVKSTYKYVNGQLRHENRGGHNIYYYYDSYGYLMAIRYYTTDSDSLIYYAATNAQGDVLGLYGGSGTLYVTYEYDSWGNLISMTDTTSVGIGSINPIRYRGYYFDSETGLYYLQSRYYDPQVGRFINADDTSLVTATPMALTDKNLYAYCDNNPVVRIDDGGEFWNILVGAVIGGAFNGITKLVSNAIEGKHWSDGLGTAVASGMLTGGFAATSFGLGAQVVFGAGVSMLSNATEQVKENHGFENFDVGDMFLDGAIGAISSGIGGKGMGKSVNIKKLNKNLTKKIFSKSTKIISSGVKYYISQTKYAYKEFLLKPLFKSAVANLVTSCSKAIHSRCMAK